MVVRRNASLKDLTSFHIGGPADYLCEVQNIEDIKEALRIARENSVPFFVLGGGTNMLISDGGFHGVVIKPKFDFIENSPGGVKVGAGVLMNDLLDFCSREGLSGLEWAGGLPGTLGGAIRGNAGCFGGEIKDAVQEVMSFDTEGGKIVRRNNKECEFAYRNSVFKSSGGPLPSRLGLRSHSGEGGSGLRHREGGPPPRRSGLRHREGGPPPRRSGLRHRKGGREIILEAVLRLEKGNRGAIAKAIEEKMAYRTSRYPLEYPSAGSMFKNVDIKAAPRATVEFAKAKIKNDPFPVIPVAYLISEAGLKGRMVGGAVVSTKHPNFIVNTGQATAEDGRDLEKIVKREVARRFGVELEEEISIL